MRNQALFVANVQLCNICPKCIDLSRISGNNGEGEIAHGCADSEAPGIRDVPEDGAKGVAPGHCVKLELCQFDRFTKDLFHYLTPSSG
jgi:hypothetical protein